MVSCYDCEYFGTRCRGILPPLEYRDRIDEYCNRFRVVSWRDQMYKSEGKKRM